MTAPLRLRVEQTAPLRAEVEHNRIDLQARLDAQAASASPEAPALLAFPELALTGYDLGARTRELALSTDAPPPLSPPRGVTALLGFPELAADGRVFNAAGAIRDGAWIHRYRKCFLPTYGSFDEGRFFAPSRDGPDLFEAAPGWRVATLICEDLWHPSLTYLAALRGADLVVVLAAVPGRGVDGPDRFANLATWHQIAVALALFHQIWVVVANRAGVERGLTFAGGSFVVAPDGACVASLPADADLSLDLTLDPEAVARARRPGSHLRDEDGTLLHAALGRLLHPVHGG
ncbi:MAG: nitrilase-related carbon-nitrogen hydrolase [Longimicrobiales bacterium]|nr:nitrilase-related carbon-nitrogen hydrolase [Longimicrobiales bacterium]